MKPSSLQRVRAVDSHTGGEPTRVIVSGIPEPVGNSMEEKRSSFTRELDWLRTASVCEPRGHEAMVGALLCEPVSEGSVAGVIFFNNVGCLNGCLHGTMGVAVTLVHLGRIGPGEHRIDTPSGVVSVSVDRGGNVSVRNVRSYRHLRAVDVPVPGCGKICGDVAWGGNWFFLANAPEGIVVEPGNIDALTEFTWSTRKALEKNEITGAGGMGIDHIEVFSVPSDPSKADSRNFVLCPGKAYDRSPCGTGTSAKLACLFDDGALQPGQTWRQAGILDSVFEGTVEIHPEGGVIPTVVGNAAITAEIEMVIDPSAMFAFGIPSPLS